MAIIDFLLHVDTHLLALVNQYGWGIYPILFLIIFIETGVVVFPFLPGDSLLFAAGALAAVGSQVLHLPTLFLTAIAAAILGDMANYWIGRTFGLHVLYEGKLARFIRQEEVQRAEQFFNEKGKHTIFIGRFLPFIRTFIPFIAGASQMSWRLFSFYNIIGALCWTAIGLFAGYFLGSIPVVNNHFSLIMIGIVAVSMIPIIVTLVKKQQNSR